MFVQDDRSSMALAVVILLGLLGWLFYAHPCAAVGVTLLYATSLIAGRMLFGPLVIMVPTPTAVEQQMERCANAMSRVHSLREDTLRVRSELERWRLVKQEARVKNNPAAMREIEALLCRMSVEELSQDLTLADAEADLRRATSHLAQLRRQIWLASLHPMARNAARLP